MERAPEHELEFLLAFDGTRYVLADGCWVKLEVRQQEATPQRPHGLRYSFTLHDRDGRRLLGFDNAHPAPRRGARFGKTAEGFDHWHRDEADRGRPYPFTSALKLAEDFFGEVDRVLTARGSPAKQKGDVDV